MLPAQKNETIWGKFGVGYVGGWVTSEWSPFIFKKKTEAAQTKKTNWGDLEHDLRIIIK